MHQILILGAGKSATILIEFLLQQAEQKNLFIHVADVDQDLARSKTGSHARSKAHRIIPGDQQQLSELISVAHLVISMLPPPLHFTVASLCLEKGRHFLNASYLTNELQQLDDAAKAKGLTFICEMGLDPGIDHMSAMEMIDGIRSAGGVITAFRSHCGGLISPESDNNPWHYKISWNPRNIVMAGRDGAVYLEQGKEIFVPYEKLFDPAQMLEVPGNGHWCWYANRDSIAYIPKYRLEGVRDFVRTTLRHPDFTMGWNAVVQMGLTNDQDAGKISPSNTREYFENHGYPAYASVPALKELFHYLGAESEEPVPTGERSSADILQWILERKLALEPDDKDMIIMLHELKYVQNGEQKTTRAYLVVKGKDQQHTAMAETVGMPLGIAAIAILEGRINRPGISIPIHREIYEVVLPELERNGIRFTYTD